MAVRVPAGRWLAHELALLLLLGSAIVVHAAGRSPTVDVPPPPTAPPPTPLPAAEQPAGPTAMSPHPSFDSRVERWRPISTGAMQTVLHTTGVRVDADLLLAVVAVESDGQPDARSPSGAVGLTQVQPATFADLQTRYSGLLAGESLERPTTNVLAGALYLAECARLFRADLSDRGDLNLVLDAYNLGPRATLEWRQTGAWTDHFSGGQARGSLPAETVEHAARIMAAYSPGPG